MRCLSLVIAVGVVRSAGAQDVGASARPSTWPSAVRPATLDERVRGWWQAPSRQQAAPWRLTMRVADVAASPGMVVLPPVVWGLATATNADGPARGARRTTEAVFLGAATTQMLKLAFGRARPSVDGRSTDWQAWRGTSGGAYQAFPSGHTTVAVAAAATWVAESHGAVPVALGAAAFAASAGAARMFWDKHWLTDVLAGAVVGTASALAVQAVHRGSR